MIIHEQVELDYDDVLLLPHRSHLPSRSIINLERELQFYHSNRKWTGFPVIVSNMYCTGTISMLDSLLPHKVCVALHKFYTPAQIIELMKKYNSSIPNLLQYLFISTGIRKEDNTRLLQIINDCHDNFGHVPNICIDVPNGYIDSFVKECSKVRKLVGNDSIIIAGNVCTGPMVQELILHGGVDIVKCGIGPGSQCTTRLKTGVGRPQLSTNIECSHAAHGLKSADKRLGLICSDGGCKEIGDISKGFASGSDFMMLGNLFAGCDENEGEWTYSQIKQYNHPDDCDLLKRMIDANLSFNSDLYTVPTDKLKEGDFYSADIFDRRKTYHLTYDKQKSGHIEYIKQSIKFYGMSSEHAQNVHYNGLDDYKTAEGIVTEVPYKGNVVDVIKNIKGGINSACSYIGSSSIKDMPKCAEFVKVNRIK